jgi:uncharacterized protein with PQ loop repeat
MKNKKKLILIFFLYCHISFSQIKISGIIIDSLTKMPIPDLSVLHENSGTISNENGEFEITVKGLPVKLIFSHVSYKKKSLTITDENYLEINLPASVTQLPEIRTGNPAIALLNSAIAKSLKDSANEHLCKAYYQKISQEGRSYTTIHEILFEGTWKQLGFTRWLPYNARFAKKNDIMFNFQNTTTAVFGHSGAIINSIVMPNSPKNDKSIFDAKIVRYIDFGTDEEIAEVRCLPKDKEKDYFEGTIFIKTKTDNIMKIVGEIHFPDPLQKKLKNSYRTFNITFKENADGFVVLDNFLYTNNITVAGVIDKKVSEKVKILVYEYLQNTSNKPKMSSVFIRNDLELIKNTTYNPSFWESNVKIKYTPLEKTIITSFEKEKAFDSNFIIKK